MSNETARATGRKEGTTSSQHGLYILGHTHATMATHNGLQGGNAKLILKSRLSSDWGLKLAPMKSESLVMAGQLYGREYVLGSCTHRPSNGKSWGSLKPAVRRTKREPAINIKS